MTDRPVAERQIQLVTDAPRGFSRAATVYGWSLAVVAVATFVALLIASQALPPLVPTLLLLAVLALCIGRAVLYPSEFALSAEVGVLLCAVVAFRDVAPFTGPLLVALFAGPLDVVHWRQRSFVPMAYNSGHRALAALAAAGAFAASVAWFGTSIGALATATVVAALAASVIDGAASVALVICLGENTRMARRWILESDATALPLAAAGGAVGFLATDVGSWAAALALVGLALVPEFLQARARLLGPFARAALLALELVAALGVVSWFSSPPSWPVVALLGALAVLFGVDLVADDRVPVPPVLGIAVTALAVATGGRHAAFAGALVAALATATAWWCGGRAVRRRAVLGVGVAVGAGVLAAVPAAIDGLAPSVVWPIAVAGVAVFSALSVGIARPCPLRLLVDVTWAGPLLAGAIALGVLPALGASAAIAFAGGAIVVSALVGAWSGSTPWRSRFVSPRLAAEHGRGRQMVFLGLCAVALGGGIVSLTLPVDRAITLVAIGAGTAATTMAAWATRQWRLAPRARAWSAGVLGLATVGWCAAV
jgi:hypothetical protein